MECPWQRGLLPHRRTHGRESYVLLPCHVMGYVSPCGEVAGNKLYQHPCTLSCIIIRRGGRGGLSGGCGGGGGKMVKYCYSDKWQALYLYLDV